MARIERRRIPSRWARTARAGMDSVALSSHYASRPRILPGPGSSLGPGLASRVRAGPEPGACSGPWVRRRPHHRARASPRPGAGTLVRVGLACGGRVHPRPAGAGGRVSGPDPGGSPDTASPLVRAAAPELPGKRPRGSRRGCHLDPRRPQGGADLVGAGRARGGRSWRGPSPGRVRAREGCSAGSWWRSPWTTCVPLDHGGPTLVLECEVHVSVSGARRRRAPRSARSPGNPRDRHLTRENVC